MGSKISLSTTVMLAAVSRSVFGGDVNNAVRQGLISSASDTGSFRP
jgi:hypothetical protein